MTKTPDRRPGIQYEETSILFEDQGGIEQTIYVRSTGSDTTGDGKTTGTAFRTVRHALTTIPYVLYGIRYIVDCTDIGQELNANPLVFPPYYSPDPFHYDSSPAVGGFTVRGPVTIQATPTLLTTITAGQLTGQTTDSVTGLRTLQTSNNYTLNQYQGKFVRDTNDVLGVIASNTAGPNSELVVTQNASFTGPIEILEPSAEIRNSGTGNAVEVRNGGALLQFNGIALTTASASSFRYGLFASSPKEQIRFNLCHIDGFFSLNGVIGPACSYCFHEKRFMTTGAAMSLSSCFALSCTVAGRMTGVAPTDANFWFECIFDSCPAVGNSAGIDYMNHSALSIDRCLIKDGTGDGVYVGPGGTGRVRRTRIKDCASNGVHVLASRHFVLLDVTGTGNTGLGLKLADGAQVNEQGTVDVTGSGGDYQVGGNTVGTWTGYSGDENDLAATTPELCRLFG